MRDAKRIEFGDWQTPAELAEAVVAHLKGKGCRPASILEPTCGQGAFLTAAGTAFPGALLAGFDVNEEYLEAARKAIQGRNAQIEFGNFFQTNWEEVLSLLSTPVLIVGNPPWVTNSALGVLDAANLPIKRNLSKLSGLDALTGKSNFDISEWMIARLLQAANGRDVTLAMLCKAAVARKIMERVVSQKWTLDGSVHAIDARKHFAAAVDAVLLTVTPSRAPFPRRSLIRWPVFGDLAAVSPAREMGIVEGRLCSDVEAYLATRSLEGPCEIEWRSGIKHDCARVMELAVHEDHLVNGMGDPVRLECEYVYPLLKGSDLANGRTTARRRVIVPQRSLGEPTHFIKDRAPATWKYLTTHGDLLKGRKSSVYDGQPDFAIFGVGEYAFAPYKVAICGLYKRFAFSVVRPLAGRPVMLDDTAYFLPCETEEEACELAAALNGAKAAAFFNARVFWDAKRPINKALLQSISLAAVLQAEGLAARSRTTNAAQRVFAFE